MCVWRRRESELVDVAIDVPVGRHVARLHLLDEVSTPGNDELPQFLLVRAISIRRRRYYSEGKKKLSVFTGGAYVAVEVSDDESTVAAVLRIFLPRIQL